MSIDTIAEAVVPAVQVFLAIGTALWAILTKNLSMAINHLTEAVKELKVDQHEISKDVHDLRERVGNIETRCSMYHNINKNGYGTD